VTVTGRWVRRGLVHRFELDERWRHYRAAQDERYATPAWWPRPEPADDPSVCRRRLEALMAAAG
jgi:hypothetical protein